MTHSELFFDDQNIERFEGSLTRSVLRPTKQGKIFGENTDTWDDDKHYPTVVREDATTYKMWYTGYPSGSSQYACYATSTDGLSWTKPTLNQVSYGGNSNNNILLSTWREIQYVNYESGRTPAYISCGHFNFDETTNGGIFLFSSSNGTSWTTGYNNLYSEATSSGDYQEGKCILQRSDGLWVILYSRGHVSQRRGIGAYLSSTSDASGSYEDQGIRIDAGSQDEQKYDAAVTKVGDGFVAAIGAYNKTAETILKTLYWSRNGIDWKLIDDQWIALGGTGEFDEKMVIVSGSFVEVGNTTRIYYSGSKGTHDASVPRDTQIGYATIGTGRYNQVSGTGNVVTEPIAIGASESLYVTSNGVSVAVLNPDQTQVSGYEATSVVGDVYDSEVLWSSNPVPTGTYRLKFTLSSGNLYSFKIE